jgi:hypothetical protein
MATLAEIMDELANTIRGVVSQVTDLTVQVEPRWVASPTYPCIDLYPADPSTDPEVQAFGEEIGGELINVRARIDVADNDASQDILLALMDDEDPLSVVAAVYDDPTLGGTASDVTVRSRSGYVAFSADGSIIGCLWSVLVLKARS